MSPIAGPVKLGQQKYFREVFMPQLIASVEGVELMRVSLKKPKTTLGRKRHNDIVFDNMVVSGEHCVFELQGVADVYIDDLGSTNGTYLNGHMLRSRELLRDKDSIVVGNFRVEYLAEEIVKPIAAPDSTRTMSLDSIGFPGTGGVRLACLKVLNGSSAGMEVPVVKAVTTFGQPGVSVVSISHRRDGYYVTAMEGQTAALVNGKELGKDAQMLADNDVLDLAGSQMQFMFATL
jgi:predicted component of type VI protein secretion system